MAPPASENDQASLCYTQMNRFNLLFIDKILHNFS